jgi:hypothetical protein
MAAPVARPAVPDTELSACVLESMQIQYQDTSKRHPLSGLMHRVSGPPVSALFSSVLEPVGRDAGSVVFPENTVMKKSLSDVMMFMMSSAF